VEPEQRARLRLLMARNARRLGTPEYLADLRRSTGLELTEADMVDGEWGARAAERAFAVVFGRAPERAPSLARFPDFGAVWTHDREVALGAVSRAVASVRPTLLHADQTHLLLTVRVASLAQRDAAWWVALADDEDRQLVAHSADGSAGLYLDSDTFSGHQPRNWTVAFWAGLPATSDL
jgi:hypothetical protein